MFKNIANTIFFGNSVLEYLISLSILVIGILFLKFIVTFIYKKTLHLTHKTKTEFDDFLVQVLYKNIIPLLYFLILYFAINRLHMYSKVHTGLKIIGLILFVTYGINLITSIVNFLMEKYFLTKESESLKLKSFKGVIIILRFILWSLSIIFLLDNFGFKISSMLAGLGIGGIAIALAAQALLGDLFSYFAILFDKPFEIGDFIVIGNFRGTIEHVGIKTTRIRSLSGEQIILSNTDLTSSRLQNYKRMDTRRVVFTFGVTYNTPLEKLKKIPKIIQTIITHTDNAKFDRAHFSEYGDFSLNFEVVYYVLNRDYLIYRDVHQTIHLQLFQKFQEEQIEFAFPTQTLYIKNDQ